MTRSEREKIESRLLEIKLPNAIERFAVSKNNRGLHGWAWIKDGISNFRTDFAKSAKIRVIRGH
jgi:hypothetical protein